MPMATKNARLRPKNVTSKITKNIETEKHLKFPETHHQHIGFAAEKARHRAVNRAQQHRHQRTGQPHCERHLPAHRRAHQQIAAERIGAEIMAV